ncbi:twin transmembrane helix small protein [Azorhizobium caulinodans]
MTLARGARVELGVVRARLHRNIQAGNDISATFSAYPICGTRNVRKGTLTDCRDASSREAAYAPGQRMDRRSIPGRIAMMNWTIYLLIPLALAAVAGVLILGLVNLAAGGSPQRSQKLMQLRVLFQFGAVVLVMITIYAMRH